MPVRGRIFRTVWRMLPKYIREQITKGIERESEDRLFENFRDSGYRPQTIIDVGAYKGQWAKSVHTKFPDVEIIMIEAQKDKKKALKELNIPKKEVHISVLSDEGGKKVDFHKGDTGSTYYPEKTQIEMDVQKRETQRLDALLDYREFTDVLLKLDVQGAELDVIEGATGILNSVSAIYTECSLVEYNEGAPLIEDMIGNLRDKGYVPYSIGGKHYWGNQLIQIDILFVRRNSEFADEWRNIINDN